MQYSIRSSSSEIVYLFLRFSFHCCCHLNIENRHALVTYSNPYMVQSTLGTHQMNCIERERDVHFRFMRFICLSKLDLVTIVSVNHCTLVLAKNSLSVLSIASSIHKVIHSFEWLFVFFFRTIYSYAVKLFCSIYSESEAG